MAGQQANRRADRRADPGAGAKAGRIRITWVKSGIGYAKDQKATIRALGLKRLHHTVEHDDTRAIRGMARKVAHLVRVEEA